MQIQQLRYFVTLVEKKSFTAAAHEFFISQSALSQQIKALEKELEVALVQRQGRSFDITPAGKLLFHKVQTILSELDSLTSQVQRVNRNLGTSLRLGLLSSMDKDALRWYVTTSALSCISSMALTKSSTTSLAMAP